MENPLKWRFKRTSPINGPFSIAMFDYQRALQKEYNILNVGASLPKPLRAQRPNHVDSQVGGQLQCVHLGHRENSNLKFLWFVFDLLL